jgi:hypothetical protein
VQDVNKLDMIASYAWCSIKLEPERFKSLENRLGNYGCGSLSEFVGSHGVGRSHPMWGVVRVLNEHLMHRTP